MTETTTTPAALVTLTASQVAKRLGVGLNSVEYYRQRKGLRPIARRARTPDDPRLVLVWDERDVAAFVLPHIARGIRARGHGAREPEQLPVVPLVQVPAVD